MFDAECPVEAVGGLFIVGVVEEVDFVAVFFGEVCADTDILFFLAFSVPLVNAQPSVFDGQFPVAVLFFDEFVDGFLCAGVWVCDVRVCVGE